MHVGQNALIACYSSSVQMTVILVTIVGIKAEYAAVDVFKTDSKGYGLRTIEPIKKNTFIIEYTGEIVPKEVFYQRQTDYAKEGIEHFYFMSLTNGELIDATKKGCIARFMNHSCNPNCFIQKWIVNKRTRIGIFALRDIVLGEELTFDYNTDRKGMAAQKCYCGEENCCGYLGGQKGSDDESDEDEIVPIEDPEDVPEFIRTMIHTLHNRDEVLDILHRLEITDDNAVFSKFKHLHGLLVLKAYLVEWRQDDEIVLKTLEVLPKLPILARNTITDAKIEEKMEIFKERTPRMKELVDALLEKWGSLTVLHRCPKKTVSQDMNPVVTFMIRTDHLQQTRIGHHRYRPTPQLVARHQRSPNKGESSDVAAVVTNNNKTATSPSQANLTTPPQPPQPTLSLPDPTSLPQVPKNIKPGSLPPNWCEVVGDEGQIYYFNVVTNKTQWERPVVEDRQTLEGYSVASINAVIERVMASQQVAVEPEPQGGAKEEPAAVMNEGEFKDEPLERRVYGGGVQKTRQAAGPPGRGQRIPPPEGGGVRRDRLPSVAYQETMTELLHHPTFELSLRFAGTTVGREKVYRAVQYFSRFLAWYLYRQGYSKETVQRFANLKSTLTVSRKLMRLGKPLEHLQAASKAIKDSDEFTRFTSIGRQLGYAGYLFWDTFVWLHLSGVYRFQEIKKINQNAARFWLFGIVCSIFSGFYKLRRLAFHSRIRQKLPETLDDTATEAKGASERRRVIHQLVQDSLDLTLPATALGYLKFDDGLLGIIGFITSIMGARNQWEKVKFGSR
ncbi:11285_t:CDS:10 [Ambispora gerdemannii]|uniref:11285_t:CDS:1 n=1 Tax=Ambispora gerdemannii TaxID=144530 RepID=A0A9N8ZCW0_9GLOM|nr:11285_t:CDS:10 [Ambispora gerdemannii]